MLNKKVKDIMTTDVITITPDVDVVCAFEKLMKHKISSLPVVEDDKDAPFNIAESEFIQRRGRLLRKSDNKNKATIYDFITLPRELDDVVVNDIEEDKTIIVGEIARMTEFGKLSDNPEVTDNLINQIMTAYDYYFDPDEEMEKMEEYYGD